MTTGHILRRSGAALGIVVVLAATAWVGWAWWSSRLPDSYNVMDYGTHDYGGGVVPAGGAEHHHHGGASASLTTLRGPAEGTPDERFTLTARSAAVELPSGQRIDALTFNGRVPGPELRVRRGDLVEVTLVNDDVESGVTIHWHGVDVPNAEDGVAGVTQDAVLPGGRHTYRFRVEQAGTFWYHTHQSSAKEVRRGLFGALVIEDGLPAKRTLDLTMVSHDFAGVPTLAGSDRLERRVVAPGTRVRLRLVNTDNTPQRFELDGTPFEVVAIDGTDVHAPTPLEHTSLELAAGGRYDVAFTMPATPVRLAIPDTQAGLVLSRDGTGDVAPADPGPEFDPLAYGTPAPVPFDRATRFDRRFRFDIGRKPGFLDGKPGLHWTINGGIYPDVPVFMVERGDLVEVTIDNDTKAVHPMHLHGHHMLVLARDGVAASGSPWWTDTLDVEPGERYEVAFRADNPGIWMDHCHNLKHAAAGMTMHVAYAGVFTPFTTGGRAHNHPE